MTVQTVRIAAGLCVLNVLFALSAGAQVGNTTDQPNRLAEQLNLARSKQHAGQYAEARAILKKALSETPGSAPLLNALASVEQDLGEYLECERLYLRALRVSKLSESDPERIMIASNLATLYLDTNQYSKAEKFREQLEKFAPRVLQEHPTDAAYLFNVIASLEHAQRRDDEAEQYYTQSLHLLQKAEGPASAGAAVVEANLGFLRLQAGQYESAANFFLQAIRCIEIASSPSDPALIRPLVNLARCENMRGNPSVAETIARRAVELSTKILGREHPVTARAMLEQATALRKIGRKSDARELEKLAKISLQESSAENRAGHTVELRDLAPRKKH